MSDPNANPGVTAYAGPSPSGGPNFGLGGATPTTSLSADNEPFGISASQWNSTVKTIVRDQAPGGSGPEYADVTVGSLLQGYETLPPDVLSHLQQQMYDGGLYPSSYYQQSGPNPNIGSVDDPAAYAAYKDAITYAQRRGISVEEVLRGLSSNPLEKAKKGGAAKQTKVITLANPDDLHAVFQQAAKQLLGRDATADEMSKFTASYQAAQKSDQGAKLAALGYNPDSGQPAYDANGQPAQGAGGVLTGAPSPTAAADESIRNDNHGEYMQNNLVGLMSALMGHIGLSR